MKLGKSLKYSVMNSGNSSVHNSVWDSVINQIENETR